MLSHVPEKLQKLSNRMGETVSRKASLRDLDRVTEDHDELTKHLKSQVDLLYEGELTPRSRAALAMRLGVKGFAIFGDNVGKV